MARAEAPVTQPCLKKCQILRDSSRGTWPTVTALGFKRYTANRSCSLSSSRKSSSTSPIIGDHTLLKIWWLRTTLSCRYTPSSCQTRARHCQYLRVDTNSDNSYRVPWLPLASAYVLPLISAYRLISAWFLTADYDRRMRLLTSHYGTMLGTLIADEKYVRMSSIVVKTPLQGLTLPTYSDIFTTN